MISPLVASTLARAASLTRRFLSALQKATFRPHAGSRKLCRARRGGRAADGTTRFGQVRSGVASAVRAASIWSRTIAWTSPTASPARPPALAGLLEVRGLGVMRLPHRQQARTRAGRRTGRAAAAAADARQRHAALDLPQVGIDAAAASAPERVALALDCALGRVTQRRRGIRRVTAPTRTKPRPRVVLVTGLSGGGKASVLRALEDLGYEAVDNPPLEMLEEVVRRSPRRLALGVDARTRGFDAAARAARAATPARQPALRPELVYVWADETHAAAPLHRKPAPPSAGPAGPGGRRDRRETALTAPLRELADLVIDTSDLPLPALRRLIERHFGAESEADEAGWWSR